MAKVDNNGHKRIEKTVKKLNKSLNAFLHFFDPSTSTDQLQAALSRSKIATMGQYDLICDTLTSLYKRCQCSLKFDRSEGPPGPPYLYIDAYENLEAEGQTFYMSRDQNAVLNHMTIVSSARLRRNGIVRLRRADARDLTHWYDYKVTATRPKRVDGRETMNADVWAAMQDLIQALEAKREHYANLMKNIDFGFHEIGSRWWMGAWLGAIVGFFFAILGAAIAPSLLLDFVVMFGTVGTESAVKTLRATIAFLEADAIHSGAGGTAVGIAVLNAAGPVLFAFGVLITAVVTVARYVQFVYERKSTEKRWSKLAGRAVKLAEVREASCEAARPMNLTLNGDLDSHKLRVLERHDEVRFQRKISARFI
ncbi:hypothetical protein BJ742DRAFT_743155 [Cladochytrium replicatum]|nr:hypothetical protein BJ742DRAFT_743155 [Cladochytrium replicatum]